MNIFTQICIMWSIILNNSAGGFIKVICIATTSLLRPNVSGPRVTRIDRFDCITKFNHKNLSIQQYRLRNQNKCTKPVSYFEPISKHLKALQKPVATCSAAR